MNHQVEATVRTPLLSMDGLYCLPTSMELPNLETALDTAGLPWSPLILTHTSLGGDCLANTPNDVPEALGALALFH